MKVSLGGKFKDILYTPEGKLSEIRDWQSNTIVNRCLDLVANLLENQAGIEGILYLALGEGTEEWDENPPEEDSSTTHLVKEIFRKKIDPTRQISYSEETKVLTINIELDAEEAVGTLREFGLFGGDATNDPNSGFLINYKTHPKIDKTSPRILKRTIQLTFAPTAFRPEVRPTADAGEDKIVEYGKKCTLDGSESRAAAERKIVKYKWLMLS